MPGRRPFSTRRWGPRMPKGCSGLQVSEDGQHPAVVGVRGCQAELAEDVPDVHLDGPLGTTRIPAIAALERPSAIRASTSRSLAVSVPSLPVRRLAPHELRNDLGVEGGAPGRHPAQRLDELVDVGRRAVRAGSPGRADAAGAVRVVDAVLEETCRLRRRVRDLPARVVVCLVLAGCLFETSLLSTAYSALFPSATRVCTRVARRTTASKWNGACASGS